MGRQVQTCPVSTEGGTRRVHLVRERGGGWAVDFTHGTEVHARTPPSVPCGAAQHIFLSPRVEAVVRTSEGSRDQVTCPTAVGRGHEEGREGGGGVTVHERMLIYCHAGGTMDATCPISTGEGRGVSGQYGARAGAAPGRG